MAYPTSNLAYKEKEAAPVHRANIRPVARNHGKRRQQKFQRKIAVVLYLMVLSCALIYGKIQLMEENYNLTAVQEELGDLKEEHGRLETAVNNMVSLSSIEELAKSVGMTEMQPSQVENIIVRSEDVAEVTKQEQNVLDRIVDFWEQMLSAIKE